MSNSTQHEGGTQHAPSFDARPTGAVVVTGTSSGMGLEAAVELARRGLDVVATMRDTARAGRLREAAQQAGVELDVRTLDVTDEAAATAELRRIATEHDGIGVLLNNAGRGCVGTAEMLAMDTVREQLEVNYLGPVALSRAVLPGMREAGAGRILTVTSVGGVVGQPFADAYCGAKFAVEGFMQSLAACARPFGVWVSVIEPAAVASDFLGNVEHADAGPYQAQLDAYLARTEKSFAAAQSQHDAGLAIADAVTSSEYRFRWQTGQAAQAFAGLSLADLDGSRVLGATGQWIQ